jgi:perosamine synthetase
MACVLVRKQIEIARAAMLRELCSPVLGSGNSLGRRIVESWGVEPVVETLSVRSAFDLYLAERDWSVGSEIVMSGANVPDMAIIAKHHGLRVRAVDFDLCELAPGADAFAQAIGARTRAVVFTQLFGALIDLTPISRLIRERDIDLVEDAAQAFDGSYRGHPEATVSMFSFGPIKTLTALGGAVSTVRDPKLADAMRERLRRQPAASALAFRKRLAKYIVLTTMSRPRILGFISRRLARRGRDLDDLLSESARSFAGRDLIFAIRERPSRPQRRLLARRLAEAHVTEFLARAAKGRRLAQRLGDHVDVPGRPGVDHVYWVFPVLCDNPGELVTALRSHGFDATRRATLAPIGAGLPRLERDFGRLVYLPFAASYTDADLDRLADVVEVHARARVIPGSYSGAV